MDSVIKYLSFTNFHKLKFWDYYTLSTKSNIQAKYDLVELSEVLTQRKEYIIIEDSKIYKRCRVQIKGRGIVLRDEVYGKDIKTKKQQLCKKDDFLVAEIDAKVGGYGIVPKELSNAIVSGHYFLFEINKNKLLPDFLAILLRCYEFSKQVKATGSTNYAAIRPYHVLGYLIPLPSLDIQKKIIETYKGKIKLSEEQEKKADEIGKGIEEFLFNELGLQSFVVKEFKKGKINLFSFNDIFDRWDVHRGYSFIFSSIRNSKYPVKTLSENYDFVNRSWDKNKHKSDEFKYVELGGVDPITGIKETKEIEVKEAPSRATQIIEDGDLIIGTTRPYLKRFAIVKSTNDKNIASSGFQVIERNDKYDLEYLIEYLKSDYGVKQLEHYMTGALYPAITLKDLKKILVPIPPIEIQNNIAQKMEEMKSELKTLKHQAERNRVDAIKEFEKEIFVS